MRELVCPEKLSAEKWMEVMREAHRLGRKGGFALSPALERLAGCDAAGLTLLLGSLGFLLGVGGSG